MRRAHEHLLRDIAKRWSGNLILAVDQELPTVFRRRKPVGVRERLKDRIELVEILSQGAASVVRYLELLPRLDDLRQASAAIVRIFESEERVAHAKLETATQRLEQFEDIISRIDSARGQEGIVAADLATLIDREQSARSAIEETKTKAFNVAWHQMQKSWSGGKFVAHAFRQLVASSRPATRRLVRRIRDEEEMTFKPNEL